MTDYTALMPMLLPAAIAAGYWAIGYIESRAYNEPFNLGAFLRTIFSGIVIAFLQALAGLTIDPASISTLAGFDGLLVIAVSKILNGLSTSPLGATATVKAAPSQAAPAAATGTDTRLRDAQGNLVTNQTGSQYWMDAGYKGPEPDAATKAAYSDAQAAYDAAVAKAKALADKYGTANLNPQVASLVPKP